MITFPQNDLPKLSRGGSDWWDTPAGLIVLDEFLGTTVSTVQALCLDSSGSIIYNLFAGLTDKKLYLNSGVVYARLSPIVGDKVLRLSSGDIVAT